ncbi:iron-containing alcohol dehydrogenase [Salinigranum sp. GCM10025319]|uniref:iron-containing alcohol dehydrogenase n=1 Tax=Salinigranum sp. GCM10025319 TaxID=3252687 RepID=UPI003608795F
MIAVLAGHGDPEAAAREMVERNAVRVPDGSLIDIIAVPTTLPGAELSQVAGVKLSLNPGRESRSEIASGGVSDARLMPTAVLYDVELVATTPDPILARSAMNGFDKGIEMLYTRHHNPLTDGTATRGVRLLTEHLPSITAESTSDADLSGILRGIAAVQYGISTPNGHRASVIHSFGHAIARNYPVQQGVAHAIAAPHALRYLFEQVDGRRDLLAEALGVEGEDDEETAAAIVAAVTEVRDALGLPSKLRSVEGAERDHVPDLARAVVEDPFMEAGPRDLDPEASDIEPVFERMW